MRVNEALTPYLYSSINVSELTQSKNDAKDKKKKSDDYRWGPNRIGQGIELTMLAYMLLCA